MEAWIYWLIIMLILSFVEIITINLVTISSELTFLSIEFIAIEDNS